MCLCHPKAGSQSYFAMTADSRLLHGQAIAASYGAVKVTYTEEAEKKIEAYTRAGFDKLPICMAKTQYRCHTPR